jgi:hypothetical protein
MYVAPPNYISAQIIDNLKHINRSGAQIDHYSIGKESQQKIDYQELQQSLKDKYEDRMIDENLDIDDA